MVLAVIIMNVVHVTPFQILHDPQLIKGAKHQSCLPVVLIGPIFQ